MFIHIYEGKEDLLTVYFLDVGQGDAILVEAPNGAQMLIDAGINGKVLESLGEVLPFYDRHIDALMMSHPDADHIGGFPDIVSAYDVGILIQGSIFTDNDISNAIKEKLGDESKIKTVEMGDRIILDAERNVYFEVMHPSKTFADAESNDASIVARLVYGETEIMFTGDAGVSVENFLAQQYGEKLSSDILKAGHHGSNTSTSDIFLGYVKPQHAIISSGKDNSYGHPHQEILDRMKEFEVEIFQTKDMGTIIMQSNGEEVKIKKTPD